MNKENYADDTMIDVGGQSLRHGIIFRSDHHEIEVKTFPIIEIGNVKLSERSKEDNRRLFLLIPILMLFLLFDEIYNRNDPVHILISSIFGLLVLVAIIATIIYYYHKCGFNSFRYIRMNHGAEHKAIAAYKNGKIEDIDKASRFVKMCGGNIVLPIIVMIILGGLIHYTFTLSMIYYVCYLYVKPVRNVLFKIIGVPVQLITTEEPNPEILQAAKIGLLRLVSEEEKGH